MAAFDAKRSFAELKRRLFRSPAVDMAETERSQDTSSTGSLLNRLQIEHDVIEVSHRTLQKDLHEQRLKQLRQKVKSLAEDDWQYVSVDQLIGLQ
ncbi:uncharacterized protein LOC135482129 [Liolophura sinensis]|uniref:uncharacterized protein LOC135482129 n=1 Tax=Liolophura sinensis TaxID=3198878 RepID=UPI0031593A6A